MKTVETYPGKWYAVTSASGCKVSFETNGGTVTLTMAAPQDVFCAVSGKVAVSDDSAVVTQTFNLAPSFFKAARGWGQDPIWFKSLHAVLTRMLDGTQFEMVLTEQGSKLIVHTDRVDDDLLEQVRTTAEAYLPANIELVQYNHNMEISWRDINKYAECVTKADILAVNPDYANDLTSDGEWVYPLDSIKEINSWPWYNLHNKKITKVALYVPNCVRLNKVIAFAPNITEIVVYAPICENLALSPHCSMKKVELYAPKLTYDSCSFYNDYNLKEFHSDLSSLVISDRTFYDTKLNVFSSTLSSLSRGAGMFHSGQLDKDSSLLILNSIPAYTTGDHPLTIGIHIDHQQDEEVLAAIAAAEAKGWTLTVQWNGTPTSTASVMRFGQLIYAKVSEHELPDGTTERYLDWGHYVTDPTGYEEFRSVEAAREYYGLPEETLTETE